MFDKSSLITRTGIGKAIGLLLALRILLCGHIYARDR